MKILYLMTEPFGYGGVQSDLLALSEDLSEKGHDVLVATSEGELLEELKSKGATFMDIDFHFSSPLKFFKSAMALRKSIRENGVELLAPQSVRTTLVAFFALRLLPFSYRVKKNGKRCPIVTTIHNIHNPVHFKYAGYILNRCADYVIFESHYERNRLLASGLPAEKSEVVHSGIDTDKFAPIDVNQTLLESYGLDKSVNKIFGIVARLSEEKGHQYLLQAFRKVLEQEPHARLMVVGDGPLKEELLAQRAELQLENEVIFTGAQRNIPDYLSIFDVFVLSSTRESFPLAAREAMAAGKPVIAPRIGGCPEVVDENNTGYLFKSADVDDLSRQMLAILADEKYKQFGIKSRQRVVELFSRKQWIVGDERVYLGFN
ncbi:MAG: glycosyltransferase [Gammaproteobacteria bacterium]|nr:glycosyltransferase [Gammaproteobacteria bacterium]